MTLAIAAAGAHGRFPSPVTFLLVIAGIAYVMWSRMQGRPLVAKRLIVLPGLYIALGVSDLTGAPHKTAADIAFLAIGFLLSAGLGAARGATIELFVRSGDLWQRYRLATVALWLALIVGKIVLSVIARVAGASGGAGPTACCFPSGSACLPSRGRRSTSALDRDPIRRRRRPRQRPAAPLADHTEPARLARPVPPSPFQVTGTQCCYGSGGAEAALSDAAKS